MTSDGSMSSPASKADPLPNGSVVVYLRPNTQNGIATFAGALINAARMTLDIAGSIAGEESVILDLSRVDLQHEGGVDALQALIHWMRGHLQVPVPAAGSSR
jgi:hypothetical protein